MTDQHPHPAGPTLVRVDETDAVRAVERSRRRPVLVRGGAPFDPTRWSFAALADRCETESAGALAELQTGVTEQGSTSPRVQRSVPAFLRELATRAASDDQTADGIVTRSEWATAGPEDPLTVRWGRFAARSRPQYLQQWELLANVPSLKHTLPAKRLWPGARLTWSYLFAGPPDTLTGLHFDRSDNWFCQLEGTKEFVLFDRTQSSLLSPGKKFDWGAVTSDLDLGAPDGLDPLGRERFAGATGWYARVGPGDALYVPGHTWHTVLALTTSLSIGTFGLGPAALAWPGMRIVAEGVLHRAHLYRWGSCTCHPGVRSPAH